MMSYILLCGIKCTVFCPTCIVWFHKMLSCISLNQSFQDIFIAVHTADVHYVWNMLHYISWSYRYTYLSFDLSAFLTNCIPIVPTVTILMHYSTSIFIDSFFTLSIPSINFIQQSATIWLCHAILYVFCSTVLQHEPLPHSEKSLCEL